MCIVLETGNRRATIKKFAAWNGQTTNLLSGPQHTQKKKNQKPSSLQHPNWVGVGGGGWRLRIPVLEDSGGMRKMKKARAVGERSIDRGATMGWPQLDRHYTSLMASYRRRSVPGGAAVDWSL